ncbi:MAG: cupin domain-containing protein [Chloroflexi bacterium]|nr:cupin domain-containing protein [Chloroflexota bacterium]
MASEQSQSNGRAPAPVERQYTYDAWMRSVGIPVYTGFYIADTREIELAYWPLRGCQAAFIQLAGQEGVSEALVTEIAPGASTPPLKLATDEIVYVLKGRGVTAVWGCDGQRRTFEWHPRSMFVLPRHTYREFHNMQGDQPVRLLHYNYLPLGMSVVNDPDFFFNNPYDQAAEHFLRDTEFYSQARIQRQEGSNFWGYRLALWSGNFFPDMGAWDKVEANTGRGAGGGTIMIKFPGSEMSCHMSMFPARTYKKAHRHGPGRVIVIPGGEGYSVMWQEGQERVVIPWHEGSLLVPPNRWFHQHFNLGAAPARYLAFHPPMQFHGYAEKVEDRARDQIEYPDEDPWVRQYFESELAKRGLTSLMPERAYQDRDFEWKPSLTTGS